MMQSGNPYQPSVGQREEAGVSTSEPFLPSLVSAFLGATLTLVLWMVLLPPLDRLVPRYLGMPLWSLTLILATAISIFLIKRVRYARVRPVAFAIVFAIFAAIYLAAEGDVSNGTDGQVMGFVYGTMLLLPFAAFWFARYTNHSG